MQIFSIQNLMLIFVAAEILEFYPMRSVLKYYGFPWNLICKTCADSVVVFM